jgi:hypothetical protein
MGVLFLARLEECMLRFAHELEWLRSVFEQKDWELIYLDPALMDLGKRRSLFWRSVADNAWLKWRSQNEYWRIQRIGDAVKKIGASVQQDFKHDPVRYFIERKQLQKIVGNREVQREAVTQLNQALDDLLAKGRISSFGSVQELYCGDILPDGSRETLDSLVIVETIIGQIPPVPHALTRRFPTFTQNHREIRYYLFDRLPHFLKADDPIIGVQIDMRVFFQIGRDIERILGAVGQTAGWYPYAKVVGHYSTLVGGTSYLNAQAIFLRKYPAIDPLLYAPDGVAARAGFFPTLYSLQMLLKAEQDEVRKLAERAQVAHEKPDPDLLYELETFRQRIKDMDERLLSPMLWLELCCKLHGMTFPDLGTKARPLYDAFYRYGESLKNWGKELKKLNVDSIFADNHPKSLGDEIIALLTAPK